ncbi:MAG: MYXO-CTERM domain-containing protein [Polyangiales bacterium]|jgi:MYXO-CTERM domain-containing protein
MRIVVLLSAFLGATALLTPASVLAETFDANPGDDIESMMGTLNPGDELVLRGGMYVTTERFSVNIAGTEEEPIVIRAAEGERPHINRPNASENLIDWSVEWVVIRGIEFSGGSAGLRFESGRDVTIEDCEIHDTADVALRMNDGGVRYERMTIRRNHIHDTNGTGEGMYLGCNSNGCQLANSLIEGNWVHHTNNPETITQGDGIEIKEGSFGNVIRDNVIHDTNYPCILTYSTAGNGAPNIIERNVMWNCGDHGIQSSADSIIRNNIVLSAVNSGIAAQPHQSGAPANMTIVNNTIVNPGGDAISIRGATGSVIVANNAVFAESGRAVFVNGDMSMVTRDSNFGIGDGSMSASLSDFVDGSFAGMPPMDLFLSEGGGLVGVGNSEYAPADDFNGTVRSGATDIGAYAFAAGGNPGWMLGEGFKGATSAPPAGDAGPGSDAGPSFDGGTDSDGGPGRDAGPPFDGGPMFDGGPGFDAGPSTMDDEGCSCRAGTRSPRPGAALTMLLVLGLVVRRRR